MVSIMLVCLFSLCFLFYIYAHYHVYLGSWDGILSKALHQIFRKRIEKHSLEWKLCNVVPKDRSLCAHMKTSPRVYLFVDLVIRWLACQIILIHEGSMTLGTTLRTNLCFCGCVMLVSKDHSLCS